MTDPRTTRAFLQAEIEGLEPFDFLLAGPPSNPLHALEVARREDGTLEVRVPGRPPIAPELPVAVRSALRERGLASEDAADRTRPWTSEVADAAAAVELLVRLFTEVLGAKPEAPLDVAHGSHRAEHEARKKLDRVRVQLEKVLAGMMGAPPTQDVDGDYVLPIDDVHVTVAPRIAPLGVVVVRVFAVTNVGVTVGPELGLFLARLNFGLMFGRFALDAENRSIWFDETLLGDHFTEEELRFVIRAVASTADGWDDRLKQMFGGATYEEVLKGKLGPQPEHRTKPGEAGYL